MTGHAKSRVDQCEYIRFAGRSVGSARAARNERERRRKGEREMEGKDKKKRRRRRRASVAAFGGKRNGEGVFCRGEDWLPRDHWAPWWGCNGPRGTKRRQKGPSRSGETRGQRGGGEGGEETEGGRGV